VAHHPREEVNLGLKAKLPQRGRVSMWGAHRGTRRLEGSCTKGIATKKPRGKQKNPSTVLEEVKGEMP